MKRLSLCTVTSLLALSSIPRWEVESSAGAAQPLGRGDVDIVYLANEGFLVRSKERAFVIDAFLKEPLGFYAALTPELHEQLTQAEGPFEDIDLALVSHAHADHFQPGSALAFLEASPETRLATSPQVIESLETALGDLGDEERSDQVRARLEALLPEEGETLGYEHEGIEVAFLRLPHAGNRPRIQNLGHLIQFEELTILHVGDADGSNAVFAPYGLKDIEIDVALLPYWFWSSPAGRTLVETQLAADTVVAIHIPPREVAEVAAALSTDEAGGVYVFREPLETMRLDAD